MATRFLNPFESLRVPGIVGKVAHTYSAQLIAQQGQDFIQIMQAEIEPGKYGFGYHLSLSGRKYLQNPGEGQGWFRSPDDALMYALGHIRARSHLLPQHFTFAIDAAIRNLQTRSLFD